MCALQVVREEARAIAGQVLSRDAIVNEVVAEEAGRHGSHTARTCDSLPSCTVFSLYMACTLCVFVCVCVVYRLQALQRKRSSCLRRLRRSPKPARHHRQRQ